MAGTMRLQDALQITAAEAQEREFAADVGPYNHVTVQIRVLSSASSGSLEIEHAAVNEESAYESAAGVGGQSVDLSGTGATFVLTSPLRFVRWSCPAISGSATFLVDLVGRA